MVDGKLVCRLCAHTYLSECDLIDVFSDEGKAQQIAPKILQTLTIMITENDPLPKTICRVCLHKIDVFASFTTSCRLINYNNMNSLISVPINSSYKEEINRAMQIPVQSLYFNQHMLDLNGVYESLTQYMKNPENNQTLSSHSKSESKFDRLVQQNCNNNNNNNSCLNGIDNGIINFDKGTQPLAHTDFCHKKAFNIVNGSNNTAVVNPTILETLSLPFTEGPSKNTSNIYKIDIANCDRGLKPLICTEVPVTIVPKMSIHRITTAVANTVQCLPPPLVSSVPPIQISNVVGNNKTFGEIKQNSGVNNCYSSKNIRNTITKTYSSAQFINRRHGSPVIKNTNIDHDYSSTTTSKTDVNVNGTSNVDNEVICLDDDDDDDNVDNDNNDNNADDNYNNCEIVMSDVVNDCNNWVNDKPVNNRIVQKEKVKSVAKHFNVKRKLVKCHEINQSISTSYHSLDTQTEEMTVTPDISLPTLNAVDLVNGNNCSMFYNVMPSSPQYEQCVSSLVTADTGFHFLYKINDTIDLTEEPQQKKKSKNKRKIKNLDYKSAPSKKPFKPTPIVPDTVYQISSSSSSPSPPPPPPAPAPPALLSAEQLSLQALQPLLPASQPSLPAKRLSLQAARISLPEKRPSLLAARPSLLATRQLSSRVQLRPSSSTKSILMKTPMKKVSKTRSKRALSTSGVNSDKKNPYLYKLGNYTDTDNWKVVFTRIELPLFQCPICSKYFSTVKYRESHEIKEHQFPPKSKTLSEDSVSTLDNITNAEQREFLVYLNLVKRMSKNVITLLADRKHFLKALKQFGNSKGSYNCQFCKYKTNRIFILWAHMSHNHVQPDSDTKSNSYCFICNRSLNKRVQLLKHLDKCIVKCLYKCEQETSGSSSSVQYFSCKFCDYEGNLILDFEKHLWNHDKKKL